MSAQPVPVPATPRCRSAMNALKHGYRAANPVLPHESQEEFDALLTSYRAEHQPASPTENRLVFDLADAEWRLNRVLTDEELLIAREMDLVVKQEEFKDQPPDLIHAEALRRLAESSRALALFQRYGAQYRQQYNRALKTLLDLRRHRQLDSRRDLQRLEAAVLAPSPVRKLPGSNQLPNEIASLPNDSPARPLNTPGVLNQVFQDLVRLNGGRPNLSRR